MFFGVKDVIKKKYYIIIWADDINLIHNSSLGMNIFQLESASNPSPCNNQRDPCEVDQVSAGCFRNLAVGTFCGMP